MKKNLELIVFWLLLSTTSFAQNKASKPLATKVGCIQRDSVLINLKEYDTNVKIFDAFQKQLIATLEVKQLELQSKKKEFEEKQNTLTLEQRQEKTLLFQKLEQEITDFNADSQQQLVKKQGELLNPLNEKIDKAIELVAQKYSYTHITDKKNFYFVNSAFDATNQVIEEANKQ